MPRYRIVPFSRETPHHKNVLHVLDCQCFPHDPSYNFFSRKDEYWWAVYYGNLPVAFGGIRLYPSKKALLCRVGVVKAHRGKGLQKKLIKKRIQFAKKNKIRYIVTYTIVDNYPSSNALIRNGFKIYNYRKAYGDKNFLWWKLELTKRKKKP